MNKPFQLSHALPRAFFSLLAFTAALSLSSCKDVKIENGQIPEKYLSEAKKFEGVYRGQFNGQRGELVITFEGNKPVVSFRTEHGAGDLIGEQCHSEIGRLMTVSLGGKNDSELKAASFEFSPKNCVSVIGKSLDLNIKAGNSVEIQASIEDRQVPVKNCDIVGGGPGNPPHEECRWDFQMEYLRGSFKR